MAVSINLPKLLKSAQVAVSRFTAVLPTGSSVKHEALGSFSLLMDQLSNDELLCVLLLSPQGDGTAVAICGSMRCATVCAHNVRHSGVA